MYNSFPVSAAVDLKDDAGEQVYGDHAELIKADLRPAQDTWNAAYSAGVSLADAYSATLWAAMSGKDWASSWHDSAQIILVDLSDARPDWYEPSDILIGHPQTLIHNAYVGSCFRLFSMRQKRPMRITVAADWTLELPRRSPYMYATVTHLPRSRRLRAHLGLYGRYRYVL
jgi:hypothetical protein